MRLRFKNPLNMLEGEKRQNKAFEKAAEEDKKHVICESCKKRLDTEELNKDFLVCRYCGNHFRIGARDRIFRLLDVSSFVEMFENLQSKNVLDFEGYDKKLAAAKQCGEDEAVITGTGTINGNKTAVFAMEPNFMMGSMGSIVGEKITRIFEYAAEQRLPVVGFSVSGGARMQEGILSLMQMAKTSAAVKKHSNEELLFISVLTNPTTGGVTASFASLGDIIAAEPGALIGFAGPRVIEQTIRKKLPVGFQRAEFVIEKGFVDVIIPRSEQKEKIGQLLEMHKGKQQAVVVLKKSLANSESLKKTVETFEYPAGSCPPEADSEKPADGLGLSIVASDNENPGHNSEKSECIVLNPLPKKEHIEAEKAVAVNGGN